MTKRYPLAPSSDAAQSPVSGLIRLVERLRRYRVGLVQVDVASLPAALSDIDVQLPNAVEIDLLQNLSAPDIERLTARRLADLVALPANDSSPRIVLNFEALFTTLEGESQQQVKKHLALAEPLMPCLLILHSDYTIDRLRDAFPNRIYQWQRA